MKCIFSFIHSIHSFFRLLVSFRKSVDEIFSVSEKESVLCRTFRHRFGFGKKIIAPHLKKSFSKIRIFFQNFLWRHFVTIDFFKRFILAWVRHLEQNGDNRYELLWLEPFNIDSGAGCDIKFSQWPHFPWLFVFSISFRSTRQVRFPNSVTRLGVSIQ